MEVILRLKYDLLHNKIITDSPPSLQQLSRLVIAINLWSKDVFDKKIEPQKQIQENVLLLPIAESFKESVALMAEFLGEQISELHTAICQKIINIKGNWLALRNLIHWTSEGTVDKKNTFEAFADCENLEFITRLEIALTFHLEDQINGLSAQLPSDLDRIVAFGWDPRNHPAMDGEKSYFELLHSHNINYVTSFISALGMKNDLNCYYCWQHLTDQQKFECERDRYFWSAVSLNVFIFLFTKLDAVQKLTVLQLRDEYLYNRLLNAFLDLRWFSFFEIGIKEFHYYLSTARLLLLLNACIKKALSTFAYKKKYTQACVTLIEYLNERMLATSSSLDIDTASRIVSTLIYNNEEKLLHSFIQSLTNELSMSVLDSNILFLSSVSFESNDNDNRLHFTLQPRQFCCGIL